MSIAPVAYPYACGPVSPAVAVAFVVGWKMERSVWSSTAACGAELVPAGVDAVTELSSITSAPVERARCCSCWPRHCTVACATAFVPVDLAVPLVPPALLGPKMERR